MSGLVRRSILGLATAGAALSTGVLVQQVGLLEEVVVTAERRELALQETPISVVAFNRALTGRRAADLLDLSDNPAAPSTDVAAGIERLVARMQVLARDASRP